MNQLTPLDITQREFGKALRGFDPREVKAFLEEVSQELERFVLENAELSERIRKLEGELRAYHEREEALKNTLLTAQRLTETLKESAKREAELLVKEAELKAERVLEQAQQRLTRVQVEIMELERQKNLFQAKLRSAIKLHLDLLEADAEKEAHREARRSEGPPRSAEAATRATAEPPQRPVPNVGQPGPPPKRP
ncbi:MAG: DivIVA domain-containing protein [candidate division NC10 bacterium]|nr:DivIVA domain-containing protein [candidate division NC10 bacterium]